VILLLSNARGQEVWTKTFFRAASAKVLRFCPVAIRYGRKYGLSFPFPPGGSVLQRLGWGAAGKVSVL